jgi:hypothetical protein
VVAVQVTHDGAHLVAQHPPERDGQGLEDRDLAPPGAGRGRHLGADEPGTDHDHPGGTRVVVEERPLVPLEVAGVPLHWRPRAMGTTALASAAALAYA